MHPELEIFTSDNFSPEKQALIRRSFVLFEDYELSNYEDPFIELMCVFDSKDYNTSLSDFEFLIRNNFVSLLKLQGIVLIDECPLDSMVEIANGLLEIQNYSDKETILRLLETNYDDEEKISEILLLVTILNKSEILSNLDQVDESIFILIAETCDGYDNENTESMEITDADKSIIKNLKYFKTFVNLDDAIGFKIINKGYKVRMSYSFYFRYLKQIFNDYKDLPKMAKELFLILLMAKESYQNPINFFRKISESLIEDISILTKLDIEISNLYNEFEKFKIKTIDSNNRNLYYLTEPDDSLPVQTFQGKLSGYEIVFMYKDKEYKVKNPVTGVKGTDIPCLVTKNSDGSFSMDKK